MHAASPPVRQERACPERLPRAESRGSRGAVEGSPAPVGRGIRSSSRAEVRGCPAARCLPAVGCRARTPVRAASPPVRQEPWAGSLAPAPLHSLWEPGPPAIHASDTALRQAQDGSVLSQGDSERLVRHSFSDGGSRRAAGFSLHTFRCFGTSVPKRSLDHLQLPPTNPPQLPRTLIRLPLNLADPLLITPRRRLMREPPHPLSPHCARRGRSSVGLP